MAHLLIPGVSLVTDEHLFSLWLHRLHKMRDIAPGSDRPWVPAVELLALPPRHVTFSKSPSASMSEPRPSSTRRRRPEGRSPRSRSPSPPPRTRGATSDRIRDGAMAEDPEDRDDPPADFDGAHAPVEENLGEPSDGNNSEATELVDKKGEGEEGSDDATVVYEMPFLAGAASRDEQRPDGSAEQDGQLAEKRQAVSAAACLAALVALVSAAGAGRLWDVSLVYLGMETSHVHGLVEWFTAAHEAALWTRSCPPSGASLTVGDVLTQSLRNQLRAAV